MYDNVVYGNFCIWAVLAAKVVIIFHTHNR